MAKRTPVVVNDDGNFVAKVEGDVIDIAISAKAGNIIVQEEDGLFAAASGGGSDITLDPNQFTTKTVSGTEVTTIKNDPDEANQLSVIGSAGLFARPASAQVRAKDKSVRVAGVPQSTNGGFNTEISVQTIPVNENQLGIAKKNDDEGLYVRSTFEQLVSPNKTIVATKSTTEIAFEPSLTDIDVAISKAGGNALAVNEDGLYVPAAPKLIRKVSSGSISWNYTDSKGSENAAGKLGSGCYLKFPLTLYSIKTGVTDVVPNVVLTRAPCDENGVIVPHQVYVGLVTAYNNTTPKAQVTVLMESIPTHTIDTTSLSIVPVGRGDNGLGVGIPEIPIVPNGEGQVGNELGYRMSVMVNSTDVA